MNRKQFIILLVLVVIAGTAGLMIHERNTGAWQRSGPAFGGKLLPGLAVNDVAQIVIRSGTNELDLARRDNLWRVRERWDYPANFAAISDLLLKLSDLKIAQSQEVGPSQLGRFALLPPGPGTNTGTLIEFKDQGGRTLNSVLLGKKHLKQPAGNSPAGGLGDEGWPDGRYVQIGEGAKTLAVISDPLDNVQPKPEPWLNKEFFSLTRLRTIALQYAEATNSWKLTRTSETNDWQLADARADEKPDASKISGVTGPFSSVDFADVSTNTGPEIFNPTNGTVLTVETFDGFVYTARIGAKQGDDYPVTFSIAARPPAERVFAKDEKPEDKAKLDAAFKEEQKKLAEKLAAEKRFENWTYYLPAYAIDPFLRTRKQLMAEPKAEPSPEPPAPPEK